MDKLLKNILEYKAKLNLTTEQCAEKLHLDIEKMQKIENNEDVEITKDEEVLVNQEIEKSKLNNSKRLVKGMDLVFRFVAMVMALVTLLLCINENVDTKVLIILLSIGLVCSSMTILPKIEK